jgi:hypothetical protein
MGSGRVCEAGPGPAARTWRSLSCVQAGADYHGLSDCGTHAHSATRPGPSSPAPAGPARCTAAGNPRPACRECAQARLAGVPRVVCRVLHGPAPQALPRVSSPQAGGGHYAARSLRAHCALTQRSLSAHYGHDGHHAAVTDVRIMSSRGALTAQGRRAGASSAARPPRPGWLRRWLLGPAGCRARRRSRRRRAHAHGPVKASAPHPPEHGSRGRPGPLAVCVAAEGAGAPPRGSVEARLLAGPWRRVSSRVRGGALLAGLWRLGRRRGLGRRAAAGHEG